MAFGVKIKIVKYKHKNQSILSLLTKGTGYFSKGKSYALNEL